MRRLLGFERSGIAHLSAEHQVPTPPDKIKAPAAELRALHIKGYFKGWSPRARLPGAVWREEPAGRSAVRAAPSSLPCCWTRSRFRDAEPKASITIRARRGRRE